MLAEKTLDLLKSTEIYAKFFSQYKAMIVLQIVFSSM